MRLSHAFHPDIAREATQRQHRALWPGQQVSIRASAGSGKTSVLTRRVLSLLLHGSAPHEIVCLTYTNVAAAEMKRRVTEALAGWLLTDSVSLQQTLQPEFPFSVTAAMVRAGREAAATVLDDPALLRFTTLHGFCQQLLQTFPLEAGLPPAFTVMEESEQNALFALAWRATLHRAMEMPALHWLAEQAADGHIRELLQSLTGNARQWQVCRATFETPEDFRQALATALDMEADAPPPCLRKGADTDQLAILVQALEASGKKAQEKRPLLGGWLEGRTTDAEYATIYLTKEGTIAKTVLTKSGKEKFPGSDEIFNAEGERVLAWQERRQAWQCLQDSTALYGMACLVDEHYTILKQAHNALDFDDLLTRTAFLLQQEGSSAWIRYRLDQRISHLMVDEAQDTSPVQWQIVGALMEEYYSGESRDTPASLLVVGDEKQSVYGFQGADPLVYRQEQQSLKEQAQQAGRDWQEVAMDVSFRSAPAVLAVVDAVAAASGGRLPVTRHHAARADAGGVVECWPPVVEERDDGDKPDWAPLPLERQATENAATLLASRIARRIRVWCDEDSATPGDILILLPRRGRLMAALEHALRHEGIACSGRDRLPLLDELAIQDLLAFGHFLLLPGDDLNTAALLKSPFGGLDEEQLFHLCHGRSGSVWQALCQQETEPYVSIVREWEQYRKLADIEVPSRLYGRLLHAGQGRARLLQRLGSRADDAIRAFEHALQTFEQQQVPVMGMFLDWFRRSASEIKRSPDSSARAVRLMTVHGAKGLEAPVVILAMESEQQQHDSLLRDDQSPLFAWKASGTRWGETLKQQQADRLADERARLLYVALTRAADRLYIAASGKAGSKEGGWYQQVEQALQALGATRQADAVWDDVLRYHVPGKTPWQPDVASTPAPHPSTLLPAWACTLPPVERAVAVETVTLPEEETSSDTPDRSPDTVATRYGSLVHRLLHQLAMLPPEQRRAAAPALARAWENDVPDTLRQEAVRAVCALLEHPAHQSLFIPDSYGEVPVTGWLGKRLVRGRIDRLVREDNSRWQIVDFKSGNITSPDNPAWKAQLAAYEALLRGACGDDVTVSSMVVGVHNS